MLDFTGSFTLFRMTKIVFYVIPNVVRNPVISCLSK